MVEIHRGNGRRDYETRGESHQVQCHNHHDTGQGWFRLVFFGSNGYASFDPTLPEHHRRSKPTGPPSTRETHEPPLARAPPAGHLNPTPALLQHHLHAAKTPPPLSLRLTPQPRNPPHRFCSLPNTSYPARPSTPATPSPAAPDPITTRELWP
ncbi:hypothetical protein SUGI_0141760 [Cryptomeria japonica]|nr:hypothetical protein SUGI_0141760 [Cryptomeria japonica]